MTDTNPRLRELADVLSRRAFPNADHPCDIAVSAAHVVAEVLGALPWRVSYRDLTVTVGGHDVRVILDDVERELVGCVQFKHRVSVAMTETMLRARFLPSWVRTAPMVPRESVRVLAE